MVENYYILGTGISGLVTGYELLKKGKQVIFLEKEDESGGLAKSFVWHGIPCDLGPHIYHTPDKDIEEYWRKEFPGLLYEREHWSKNYKDSKLCDYPLNKDYIDSLPEADQIYFEIEKAKNEKNDAVNFYDYIKKIAGPTLQEMFFLRYPEKLWGLSTKDLDANWAPKRIEIRPKSTPFYWGQYSAVGNEGSGTIINALLKKIVNLGGRIYFNSEVIGLERDGYRIKKILTSKGVYTVNANDIVINSVPVDVVNAFLGYKTNLYFRGVILVYLYINKKTPLPKKADFIYFDSDDICFTRLVDQRQFILNPPNDKNIYILEIPYTKGDEIDKKCREKIIEKAVCDFGKLNFVEIKNILDTKLIKLPRVYPVLFKGYRKELPEAMSGIDKLSNFYNIGSLAEYAYNDMQILFSKGIDLSHLLTDKTLRINGLAKRSNRLVFKSEIIIGEHLIGENNPTFTIAEIGLNHNGSVDLAKQLIDEAVKAGAQSVKLQVYKAENRVAPGGKTSRYVEKILGTDETDYEMLKKYELSETETKELFGYAKDKILVFATPFDEQSVDSLEKLGIDCYKIASFDLVNLPLLKKVAMTGKPMILSTGMATLSDIEDALMEIVKFNDSVILLHCSSTYPCPSENMNIRALDTMKHAFKVPIGLSDHSIGNTVAVAAVARGASVIEKHFTLDRNMEGPDHALSLEPSGLSDLISQIGIVERCLGDGIKQPSPTEFATMLRFRKTMYAARDIKENESLCEDDIVLKGPAFGIYPKFKDIILGKKAATNINKDMPITWDSIA